MAGVVAAGHEETAEAGRIVFEAGGNAFDAAVGALLAACVAEPTLTSIGGGGFLLAHTAAGQNRLFDFFTQTPKRRAHCPQPDFYPIEADFGDTVQTFHVGRGSIAVPGVWAGILTVHKQLGKIPLTVVAEPAVELAREGLEVSPFQDYCYQLLDSILMANAATRRIFAPARTRLKVGERLRLPRFADTLSALVRLGDEGAMRAFYHGEIAAQIVADCQAGGGYLQREDFESYEVIERSPLDISYRGTQLLTNPPPSAGGALIAFCLELLDRCELANIVHGSAEHIQLLAQAMRWTNVARRSHLDAALFDPDISTRFVAPDLVEKYLPMLEAGLTDGVNRWGSTTHISTMDDEGNAASVTTSNGEGSAYIVPGMEFMLNNMLGEEDLNPHGFNQWPLDRRQSSMMAPTMILRHGKPQLALGSGGSNRIRTAILQVISNIVDFKMPLKQAVSAPRIHWENGQLHLEPGHGEISEVAAQYASDSQIHGTDRVVAWQGKNMFFGGVHSVTRDQNGLHGAGDARRSGAVRYG